MDDDLRTCPHPPLKGLSTANMADSPPTARRANNRQWGSAGMLYTLDTCPMEPSKSHEILAVASETMQHIMNSSLRHMRPCKYHKILASLADAIQIS